LTLGKPYTRTGDKGITSAFGPGRIWKGSARVEAIGSIDELVAAVGVARALIKDTEIKAELKHIQEDLFIVATDLATIDFTKQAESDKIILHVSSKMVQNLEKEIKRYVKELETPRSFIIPGTGISSALLHYVRSVARRAERRAVAFAKSEKVNDQILAYLNRVSSLIFILARLANQREGLKEDLWRGGRRSSSHF
jgi:cob(I)alamin adenosyltransferase